MIRCVIFDIDNTVYSYTKANDAAMKALYAYTEKFPGLSRSEFDRLAAEASRKITGRLSSGSAAIHNRLIRFQNILEVCGKSLYPYALEMYSCYWDTLLDNMECAPYCRELFRELGRKNIRTGIGTDMTALMQYRKLEKLEILPLIRFMVTSEEAGAEKPDRKFFELCIQKAQCAPEECLFIGDNLKKDILGAQKAGMKTLWYCPEEETAGNRPAENTLQEKKTEGRKISSFREILDEPDKYLLY